MMQDVAFPCWDEPAFKVCCFDLFLKTFCSFRHKATFTFIWVARGTRTVNGAASARAPFKLHTLFSVRMRTTYEAR
uniref:Uncharacterized protein n=1 Tax=Zea mays TaxID=4577 RepID=C0PIA8_MAIZE|nr:unknown [Zea mays]